MLTAYYYLVTYRLDLVFTALLAIAGGLGAQWYIRRRSGRPQVLSVYTWLVVGALILTGGLTAEWTARNQIEKLQSMFSGFGPTYAQELAAKGHEYITLETAPNDPRYLELIALEMRWLKNNPTVADIYTFRRDTQGRLRLIVDSETDYDHDGVYDEDREKRTPIGEIYEEATPKFFSALDGHPEFESTIMTDRWGIWVSAFYPIYDHRGQVEAAVGIDFPAETWLDTIGTFRTASLLVTLVLIAIVLTSSTLIALMRDEIGERKAALVRLEQARESALEASAAKSEFLAITSHEVRTPLSAILGFATILADTPLDPTQRRYLDTMNQAGQRLMDLLNGILDFTRIESGKLELEQLPWAPALLIHEVMGAMSARAQQTGVPLYFENRLPGNLTLKGDTTRVRQILLNLLSNALKFTAEGRITIRADWTPPLAQAVTGEMVISVIDTGRGIPADKIAHLFKAFAQVDASTTRLHGGSGLGLAISKRLADMMGGSLTVQSTLSHGSEFRLALHCTVVPVAIASGNKGKSGSIPAASYTGRALVVDDERLNRELLRVMLRRCGLEADLAASGPEAITLASRTTYTIILTDLEMPDMDGFTTAARIRTGEAAGTRVPIVAVSALTAKGTRERCIDSGMDDYLTKPVYLPALYSTLEALLPKNGAGAKPAPITPVEVA